MDETRETGGTAKGLPVLLASCAALAALATLYVLSVGPAVLARDSGLLSQPTLLRIYFPLAWLEQHSSFFRRALEWYCSLWV